MADRKAGFYEKMVVKALLKMQSGSLDLILPDKEILRFGNQQDQEHAEIVVNDYSFFKSIVLYGDIGFGESYTNGIWDTPNITFVIKWIIKNLQNAPSISGSKSKNLALNILKWVNKLYHTNRANSLVGSRKNIEAHYDLSNAFFQTFLDPSMTYSSAYFKDPHMNLEDAQCAKYERLAAEMKIKPSDHILEIGTGWGSNAIFLAKKYGCKVSTITISKEQEKLAKKRILDAGLDDLIKVYIQDYRKLTGKFDKIVSVEMLEAVGHSYLKVYFAKCQELLKPNGILAFQVITSPDSRYEELRSGVDWIQKHIFPGSLLPSVAAINNAINKSSDFTLVDLKDLGLDYAKTLNIWHKQFNDNIEKVKSLGFNEQFIRKWNYYLNYCEAAFSMRNIHVMQMIYTRPNNIDR